MNILLYISNGLIITGFLWYLLLIFLNSHKKISEDNGFDITKDLISEYDSINIIENTGKFTFYNIKRQVIKLSTRCYYANDLSYISIGILEAGISIIDKEDNKYINILKKIFSNLKLLYIFPIISLIININSYTVKDAEIGLILLSICVIISYLFINILNDSLVWINKNINKIKTISKDNRLSILNYLKNIITINKLIFFGELLIIIRLVSIMIER
ncbi:MAG: zinc metallopeptidase [Bacilli bacterium]|nr:zinc metallopeptidase [Bacilli bacterium]MBQ8207090.1 zinc metallopeptidase [Bacilli bacterium]